MKKGLRFQTQLMIALVAAIAVTTVALIVVTENKVSQAYTHQFSREFTHLVGQLERSREERSAEFMEISARLASHPYVVASLKGEAGEELSRDFWRSYLELIGFSSESTTTGQPKRSGVTPGDRPLQNPELHSRFGSVGIVSPDGEITPLLAPFPRVSRNPNGPHATDQPRFRKTQAGVNRAKQRIDELLARERQEVLYLPFENAAGVGHVQEMVSTPVQDPDTGRTIGLFLRATPAETEAQRFLERYQEMFPSDSPLLSAIYLDGELFSRHLDPTLAEALSIEVHRTLSENDGAAAEDHLAFEAELGEVPYRVYVKSLPGDHDFDPAYQVTAYSLAPLRRDLAELRLRGTGVGTAALLVGIVIAWFFSRRLAVPIGDLTRASLAIRDGRLETRIAVRSRDEIGELAESFNGMAEGLQQRDAYRGILGKVSDETVAQAMISGDLDLELGGELKQVSVLFCDIRGFTSLTEHMPPTEVIGMLNEHMTAMTAIVRKHYGVVDKFVGDEIMAVFGALKSYGNDAAHAAACALEMVAERGRLNRGARQPIEIGVGVASGEAVAGCMGSVDRLNYTVVGSRVNLASRLCSEARAMEVVIDDHTLSSLELGRVEAQAIEGLRLKGFSETVAAYRVRAGVEVGV